MTIATARDEIRSRRHIVVLSRKPWTWRVLSTAGDYHHVLHWNTALKDIVCDVCRSRYGRGQCWARRRCLAQLRIDLQRRQASVAGGK